MAYGYRGYTTPAEIPPEPPVSPFKTMLAQQLGGAAPGSPASGQSTAYDNNPINDPLALLDQISQE